MNPRTAKYVVQITGYAEPVKKDKTVFQTKGNGSLDWDRGCGGLKQWEGVRDRVDEQAY